MTPEQREKKKQADRDRRARLKAQGLDAKAIRAGGAKASKPAKVNRKKELADINAEIAKVFPGKPVKFGNVAPKVKPRPFLAQPVPKLYPPAPRVQHPGRMVVISFKGTTEHRDKLQRLGGGSWARNAIDKARE